MSCACIVLYRPESLDESIKEILNKYAKYVIEDTCWFSIEFEWRIKHTHTDSEKQQLISVFDRFPGQEILILGECDRIFVAAYEIINRFGGLLRVNIGADRKDINSHKGIKIEVHKKKWKNPSRYEPDYWLVDHIFIKEFFASISGNNFEKFKLDVFMPYA
jgi:hypothetical protein